MPPLSFVPRRPTGRVLLALGVSCILHAQRGAEIDGRAPNRSAALATALRARGIACEEGDVTWLEGPRGVLFAETGHARALVRGAEHGEPSDLFAAEARLSPEGVVLSVGETWNLTRTSGVEESRPLVRGSFAAYTTALDGVVTGVHLMKLDGPAREELAELSRVQRWQAALTAVQQTGHSRGVVRDTYTLDPPAAHADITWSADGMLGVEADGRHVTIDPETRSAIEGSGWVRPALEGVARPPGIVQWSVDRVRAMPWFGDEKMQWLKAIAFTGLDWVLRARERVSGDGGASEVARDLGGLGDQGAAPSFTDPEIGWPPAPMKPTILPALPGEGAWIPLDRDPFIGQLPGLPPAFVTSFVRTDKERLSTRIYVTLWDPRQIALHMEAGTVEPVSATGEAGPGVVPRTPEVLRHLVAGFNGGFQAIHGEYGMQASGVLYLPPKPYAATVMELRDGTTALGSWPREAVVPDEVLSFRQNMTAMMEDDVKNPWGRTWWGGTPPGWEDRIHTTRSGICLTKENFVGYFWGNEISEEALADGMKAARCAYGIHLDMNPGLAGFEFYKVGPAATWKPLERKLQSDWEWEGQLDSFPDTKIRARRMVKGMGHINFPQYVHVDARDFFYLTTRALLPGEPLASPLGANEPGEGEWRVKGLPQHGFPYAVATTSVRIDAAAPKLRALLLRVDPRVVVPAASAGTTAETPTVVSFAAPVVKRNDTLGIWLQGGVFFAGREAPGASAFPVVTGAPPSAADAGLATAVAGVQDEDGMLVWIELPAGEAPSSARTHAMDAVLAKLGCRVRVATAGIGRAWLGGPAGVVDLTGAPPAAGGGPTGAFTRLVRGEGPAARRYFPDTKVVPPAVWQPLQSQRVRYFPKKHEAPSASASTSAAAPPSSPPPAPTSAPRPAGTSAPPRPPGTAAPRPAGTGAPAATRTGKP